MNVIPIFFISAAAFLVFFLQYAVRGNVLDRSMELQRRMAAGEKLPFEKVGVDYSVVHCMVTILRRGDKDPGTTGCCCNLTY